MGLPDCIQENLLKKAAPAVNTHTDEVPVSGREEASNVVFPSLIVKEEIEIKENYEMGI